MKTINSRTTDYPIDDLFLKRYSPRALSGEPVTKEELLTVLEAARWAPSSRNYQPWRFVYGVKATPHFDTLFSFVDAGNQVWAKDAGALIVIIADTLDGRDQPSPTYALEAGLATENLLLQATSLGLVAHPIGGILREQIVKTLELPERYVALCMVVVGRSGDVTKLPDDLRAREVPSDRKSLSSIAFEGTFEK